MSQQPPAGWYPDPANPQATRWWDGSAWADPVPQRQTVSGYPAAPQGPYAGVPARVDADTNTTWIWLIVAATVASAFTVLLFNFDDYLRGIVQLAQQGEQPSSADVIALMNVAFGSVGLIGLLGLVLAAAQIVFAYLDWKTLQERGVVQPFHWAFAFFVLVISIGVYVIGRSVVVYKRTGKGLAPLWGWIIALVVPGIIVGWIFFARLIPVLEQIEQLAR